MVTVTKSNFKMPTPLLIDGHQQYCTVMMESNKVTLQLRNSTFNIGFDVPIEQKRVDGLVHLINVLKLCEGLESLAYESTTEHVHVNEISFLDSEKLSRKTFSKSCNSILNWSSKKKSCVTCANSIASNRKKKEFSRT